MLASRVDTGRCQLIFISAVLPSSFGRAGALFTNLERIVEPYEVRSWYKMSETGKVKAILEPAEGSADYGRAVA
jgi:hypothetical protein